MGLMDKFLDVMRLNSDDDDFYDDDYDDYEEDLPRKRSRSKDKEEEDIDEDDKKIRPIKSTSKVTPMRTAKKSASGMEVCVIKPVTVEDAREITETLLLDRTVVLNVEGLDVDIAQRIIDFTSDSCFAINGNLQKISNYIFIITPPSVDVSGDFANIMDSLDMQPMRAEF